MRPPRDGACTVADRCMHRSEPPRGRSASSLPRWRRKRWNSRARRRRRGSPQPPRLVRPWRAARALDERLDVGSDWTARPTGARSRGRDLELAAVHRHATSPSSCGQRQRGFGSARGHVVGTLATGSPTGCRAPRNSRAARDDPVGPRSRCRAGRALAQGLVRRRAADLDRHAVGDVGSSAPSETTSCTPSASTRSAISVVRVRQRIDRSGPPSSTRSRGARGTRAAKTRNRPHDLASLAVDQRHLWAQPTGSRRTPPGRSGETRGAERAADEGQCRGGGVADRSSR